MDRLARLGATVETFATRQLDRLPEALCRLRPERFDAIFCAGGDGTHYHVLNGLIRRFGLDSIPPLGIVPLGRGNSFARDLNLLSVDDAAASIAEGKTRPVDLCRFRCNGREAFFTNLMGVGFVTDVAATAARFRRARELSYVIGVFSRLPALRPLHLKLEIDGRDFSGPYCFVEICNSRYTGGSMLMAPGARFDDGRFDVVMAGPMTRLELIRAFPLIYRGTHLSHPAVRVVRGASARIECDAPLGLLPDGELIGTTPVEIQVIPRCLNYFTR